jgi:hypothetical protein
MTLDTLRHCLYDLLGTRVPYVVLDAGLGAPWEYRPARRLLTLRATDADTVLDAAAVVYLASSADLGKGPCRAVPPALVARHAAIRRNLAKSRLTGGPHVAVCGERNRPGDL